MRRRAAPCKGSWEQALRLQPPGTQCPAPTCGKVREMRNRLRREGVARRGTRLFPQACAGHGKVRAGKGKDYLGGVGLRRTPCNGQLHGLDEAVPSAHSAASCARPSRAYTCTYGPIAAWPR